MASIRWTVDARRDLREIVDYIRRDSPAHAAAFSERIASATEPLRRHPRLGRVVPEYGDEAVREVIVGNYRVMYRLQGRRIDVLAVIHGSRDVLRHPTYQRWQFE